MPVLIHQATDRQIKALAKRLQTVIPEVLGTAPVPLNQTQRIVAKGLGHADFHAALAFHGEAAKRAAGSEKEPAPVADPSEALFPVPEEGPTLSQLVEGLRWVETDEHLSPVVMAGAIRFLEAWFPVAEAAWPGPLSWSQVRRGLLHGAVLALAHRSDIDVSLRQPLLNVIGQWHPRDADLLGMALIWSWRSGFLIGPVSQVEQQLQEEQDLISQDADSVASHMAATRSRALLKMALAGLGEHILMTRDELWQRMSFPSLILRSRDPRVPKAVRDMVAHYLSYIPGFSLTAPPTRSRMITQEQHGFVQMYWARQLSPVWPYRAALA